MSIVPQALFKPNLCFLLSMPISDSFHPSSQFQRIPKNATNSFSEDQAGSSNHNSSFLSYFMRPQNSQKANGETPMRKPNVSASKKEVRYRECRKNHAASTGGYAVDGCRGFMASGEEGTSGALKCAACGCHRSFHRREVEDDCSSSCFTKSNTRK